MITTTGIYAGNNIMPPIRENLKLFISPYSQMKDSSGGNLVGVGGSVGWVEDLSGTGNHLVQATAGWRPKKASNGIYFDGVDDKITTTLGTAITSSCTVYGRFFFQKPSNYDVILSANDGTVIPYWFSASSYAAFRVGSTGGINITTANEGLCNFYTVVNGASSKAYLNGAELTGTLNTPNWSTLYLGSYQTGNDGYSYQGLLHHFLIYTGAHTTEQTAQILGWLNSQVPVYPVLHIESSASYASQEFKNLSPFGVANTITVYGQTLHSTEQALSGKTTSIKFDGNGDYLQVPNNEFLNFGTSNFTISFDIYTASNATTQIIISRVVTTSNTFTDADISFNTPGTLYLKGATASFGNIPLNQWVHVILVRSNGTVTCYYDGVQKGTASLPGNINSTYDLKIGLYSTAWLGYLNGYLDNIKVYKGVAIPP